ncbi:DNA-binding protein [Candidatus Saccharibacteria bacterium]|nr:DNA-binding protein [Candidatus Saccharibacteria bacterium]
MKKELIDSSVDRKNILNNSFAIAELQGQLGIGGVLFEGEYRYTTQQVADFYEVSVRTVRRYLSKFEAELRESGYVDLENDALDLWKTQFGSDTDVTTKLTRLGVFNFKALLNIGFLLKESEKARILRGLVLDLVINVVAKRAGGDTKYINQREDSYLLTTYMGEGYRKEFTGALDKYVDLGPFKYTFYTNKIYVSIFKEHAAEYKKILSLSKHDKIRDTMYSEVLTAIATYETGLAHELKRESERLKRKLNSTEADKLFKDFEDNPAFKPQIEVARRKMASRDYGLRDTMHPKLEDYVGPIDVEDFERFLGEKSADLAKQIERSREVFKRLKDQ